MLFKVSNPNSNLALTLGYLNPALNNSAQNNNAFPYVQKQPNALSLALKQRLEATRKWPVGDLEI